MGKDYGSHDVSLLSRYRAFGKENMKVYGKKQG